MNQEESNKLVEQASDIYNEFFALEQSHKIMKENNISRLYYYAQFYYERINELIKELKGIIKKLGRSPLSEAHKNYIRVAKSEILSSCSEEFQYEISKNSKDYESI